MIFVDTNYFIRFFLKDVSEQHDQVLELFDKASGGEVKLFTSTIVWFEIYWVLASFYKRSKQEVAGILSEILSWEFIRFEERVVLSSAINLFSKSNLSLEDSYNISFARDREAIQIKTFDRKLAKEFERQA